MHIYLIILFSVNYVVVNIRRWFCNAHPLEIQWIFKNKCYENKFTFLESGITIKLRNYKAAQSDNLIFNIRREIVCFHSK